MDKIKLDKSKMTPTPTTYKVEQKDDRKILSTRQRSFELLFNGKQTKAPKL